MQQKSGILLERLQTIVTQYQQVKLASSLAVEDCVITDVIAKHQLPINIFTLDTGLMNAETLTLITEIEQFYQAAINIEVFAPETSKITAFVGQYGNQAYYESIELRKQCCYLRKIEPLNQALHNADAWLTGQRQSQSVTRTNLPFSEQDQQRQIAKFNPIFDWSEEEVWAYILHHNLPYNRLYQQGYSSIGCAPCTRPIKADEDIRAGRWWWENKDSKECGLHK